VTVLFAGREASTGKAVALAVTAILGMGGEIAGGVFHAAARGSHG
jgi:hypothetical protein